MAVRVARTSRRRPAASRGVALASGVRRLAHGLPPHLAGQHRLALPLAAAVPALDGAGPGQPGRPLGRVASTGVPYLQYVVPGILAAQAMWVAVGESTYQVLGAIRWNMKYHAMLATPIGVRDILRRAHHLRRRPRSPARPRSSWPCRPPSGRSRRGGCCSACRSPSWSGSAFTVPIFAFSATQESDGGFNILFRFVITPLILFSGTFFPIEQLPPVAAAGRVADPALARRRRLPRRWPGLTATWPGGRCTCWSSSPSLPSAGGSRCAPSAAGWSYDDPHRLPAAPPADPGVAARAAAAGPGRRRAWPGCWSSATSWRSGTAGSRSSPASPSRCSTCSRSASAWARWSGR